MQVIFQILDGNSSVQRTKQVHHCTHIQRVNYICARDKSYILAKQDLQSRENHGWNKIDGSFQPTTSLNLPAPKAVMELVKCGCKKNAQTTVVPARKITWCAHLSVSALTVKTVQTTAYSMKICLRY